MEREACVGEHGFERSGLCAEIIIIIIIMWSQRIFPSLPGSRLVVVVVVVFTLKTVLTSIQYALQFFYRDASSALLQLVNQWLNFTHSRSHAFRYERKNTNPTFLVRTELTTSVLADVQLTY